METGLKCKHDGNGKPSAVFCREMDFVRAEDCFVLFT